MNLICKVVNQIFESSDLLGASEFLEGSWFTDCSFYVPISRQCFTVS